MLWGIAIGGLLGGLFGGDDGPSSRERREMAQRETDSSYEFGENAYGLSGQLRENAETKYETDYAGMRARLAASGGTIGDEQYEAQHGELVRERDEAFREADMEMDRFRASENYSGFNKDFDRQVGQWKGGKWSMGASMRKGASLYNDEQRQRMKALSDRATDGATRGMMDKAIPTIEDYEHLQFGTDEQKAVATKRMDDRLTEVEGLFDQRRQRALATRQNAKAFRGRS